MSKATNVLIISPPLFISSHPIEQKEFKGFSCTMCKGNTFIPNHDSMEEKNKKCPFCNGTGKMKAVVKIEWVPD